MVNPVMQLFLYPILHQTTTTHSTGVGLHCCFSILFYIKPQLFLCDTSLLLVVSLSYSTSNHNNQLRNSIRLQVVSLSYSTSNHNPYFERLMMQRVVSLSYSTSNHNLYHLSPCIAQLFLYPILHQTTTFTGFFSASWGLFLYPILHQTTTCCT